MTPQNGAQAREQRRTEPWEEDDQCDESHPLVSPILHSPHKRCSGPWELREGVPLPPSLPMRSRLTPWHTCLPGFHHTLRTVPVQAPVTAGFHQPLHTRAACLVRHG